MRSKFYLLLVFLVRSAWAPTKQRRKLSLQAMEIACKLRTNNKYSNVIAIFIISHGIRIYYCV